MAKTPKIIVQKATAFQLNPKHSYIIHLPGVEPDDTEALQAWLKEQGIEKALIVTTETMNISEVPELPNTAK
jgi:nicotinic acid phosphoribosyltransferase